MPKSRWLQEVEDDATRIANKRFADYFEEQQYQNEKIEEQKAKSFPERMAAAKAIKAEAKVVEVQAEPIKKNKGDK